MPENPYDLDEEWHWHDAFGRKDGKGREYQKEILDKCGAILRKLGSEMAQAHKG